MSVKVLDVENLMVSFPRRSEGPSIAAVRGLSLTIDRGRIHALVGESGAGKSVVARAIIGLLPESARVEADRLVVAGVDHAADPTDGIERLRGRTVSMVFQEPAKHLNPVLTIGGVMREVISRHLGMSRRDGLKRARELMELVGLRNGPDVMKAYPHELSGGMKQRAMIALAISCGPDLLLADEPTTSLDATVQRQILELIDRLRRELGMSVLFVSHDLGVVQSIADTVSVIYAGRIVETAAADALFSSPIHPYTELLLDSIPEPRRRGRPLETVRGTIPDAGAVPSGCAFHTRCPIARPACAGTIPELADYRPGHSAACLRAEYIVTGKAL